MTDERVQDHYANAGTGSSIAARIAAAVRAIGGPNTSITSETLAPFDHFHGGGLATTQELVAALQPQAGETILDIGCGSGGPAPLDGEAVQLLIDRRRSHAGVL